MNTYHIHIEGRVQGVGFRPFVYKLAKEFDLNGWVNNTLDGVHVEFSATEHEAKKFCKSLIEKAPELSVITNYIFSKVWQKDYQSFDIIHSDSFGKANLMLSPDYAICEDCLSDLNQPGNRRFEYAFTTCTNCGPRFSISRKLPYDRNTTAMKDFAMCAQCLKEYNDPSDRRYYSQTNSCPDCQITMKIYDNIKNVVSSDQKRIPEIISSFWKEGKIIAVKGIGGYLLTCDASNKSAIQTLRERKNRPAKPFAIMFERLDSLEGIVTLRKKEMEALSSPESPIVLLKLQTDSETDIDIQSLAPGLDQIGVMLAYAPIYQLLLKNYGRAIVATSGNVSNAAIVYQDVTALENLSGIADYILTNNREIVIPQDDSVVKFSQHTERKIILRRSRGLAPSYFNGSLIFPTENVLAIGSDLKSTFSLIHSQNCYISQYIGDLESYDSQESYQKVLSYFLNLFESSPAFILADKHPNYFSTNLAKELAEKYSAPLTLFQHHLSHFAAVLGENNQLNSLEPILGVIWDGTGFGDDGHIWGGEFFTYNNFEFERATHFEYFPFIFGNKMPKEPRISALAIAASIPEAKDILRAKFSDEEWNIYQSILKKESSVKTSSLGRIFDSVASLLGLIDQSSYEGEAAMLLENLATKYVDKHGMIFHENYFNGLTDDGTIPVQQLIKNMLQDLNGGLDKEEIAAKFHYSLVCIIKAVAEKLNIRKIAFSGGVFQNSLLVDLISQHFEKDFNLYFHKELSPNDENISFGQVIYHYIQSRNQESTF